MEAGRLIPARGGIYRVKEGPSSLLKKKKGWEMLEHISRPLGIFDAVRGEDNGWSKVLEEQKELVSKSLEQDLP